MALSAALLALALRALMAMAHFGSDGRLACRSVEAGSKLELQCGSFIQHVERMSGSYHQVIAALLIGAMAVFVSALLTFAARKRALAAAQQAVQGDGPASGGSAP